ncbi:MAG TPA: DoxX family membrane protein [Candidatus Omnitrophota bacterium]|nr:DoxX family membrane protein [Candidatus Omnitrophota bacterium]
MMKRESSYTILFLGRLLIGLIFAYSGYTKLVEPVENFQAAIAAYEIIPYVFIPWIARLIPWIEFIFGVFVIVGYLTRISAAMLAAMSWSFVMVIALTWLVTGSIPADCGCFGEGSFVHFPAYQIFILDVISTLIGIRLCLMRSHPLSLDALLGK